MKLELLNKAKKDRSRIKERFKRNGALTGSKLLEYIPAMILTNLSVLMLLSVDGLVVGNLVGADALSAVNIFYPATTMIGVASVLVASGAGSAISTCMGKNDIDALRHIKSAVKIMMIVAAIIMSIVQIPFVYLIIASYNLSPEMNQTTWLYAIGIMISTPFGLVSTVGVYQLQIVGKMKVLMWLSAMEGIVNIVFDLLFVGVLNMGVIGAGLGTACANIIRSTMTVIYLVKKTDMFCTHGVKAHWSDIKELISCGLPEASNSGINALQNYFMVKIIIFMFGATGGVIKGVCTFCMSLVNVIINSTQGSMRPLAGLLSGAEDHEGLRFLMRQCIGLIVCAVGAMVLLIEFNPDWFYFIHGVKEIPDGGLLSLRLFVTYFIFKGIDSIFRLYFTNRKDSKFSTKLTVFGNATLPIFAFAISMFLPAPFIWLSYLFTELLIILFNIWRYRKWLRRDAESIDPNTKILYLTVEPEKAMEASGEIYRYAKENGFSDGIANKIRLCMEEMVAYAVKSQEKDDIRIQITVRFSENEALFAMLDDGKCIALNENKELQEMTVDNYDFIKKQAKSVQYQYVLDMNYSVLRF
ncbi:MAG: hypothetical protein IJH37_04720 [Clostridia bacterium]|nr:hypothetical protein [Clostridia bacterium]